MDLFPLKEYDIKKRNEGYFYGKESFDFIL